jgi:hypothetical protein
VAWTQSDIDQLKAAISAGRGARVITFGDQSVQFNSIAEMLQLLSVMQAEVAFASGRSRTRLATTSKGV